MNRRKFIKGGASAGLFAGLSPISFNQSNASQDDNFIYEVSRKIEVAGTYNVIVSGGGPAGVTAAIAAARMGAKVLLVELNGCLGGVWTAGILAFIFDMHPGIGQEIIDRLDSRNAWVKVNSEGVTKKQERNFNQDLLNFTYDIEAMKLVLEEMMLENNIDVLLHTRVVAAEVNDNKKITGIITESKSGRQGWRAHAFVDCTGDGDLGALAGNAFKMRSEQNEIQPMTYMALISVPDVEKVGHCISFYQGVNEHGPRLRNFKEYLREVGVKTSYGGSTLFQVRKNLLALMINHEYGIDPTDARQVTKATMSGRAEVNKVVDALSQSSTPFKGSHLVATAEHIGVREGRRISGLYTVSQEDMFKGASFKDGIVKVQFGVDIHATDPSKHGGGNTDLGGKSKYYEIPIRALIAKDIDGLLMAGRCISGDWVSFSSYRVTGEAVSMGQAAGTLAAASAAQGKLPRNVNWEDFKSYLPLYFK